MVEGLHLGLSICRRAILRTMEEVVFVSERAVGKRRREDEEHEAVRKRVQLKEESSSDDDSSSDSESSDDSDGDSDDDSNDEQNAKVENAMSAVRISTEPQDTPSVDSLIAHIKSREHVISQRVMLAICSSLHRSTLKKHMRDAYIEELQIAFRERRSEYPQRKWVQLDRETDALLKRPQEDKDLNNYTSKLERQCKTNLKQSNAVRQVLQSLKTRKGKWTVPKLFERINAVRTANKGFKILTTASNGLHVPKPEEGIPRYSMRNKPATNNTLHTPGVQGEDSRSGGVHQGAAAKTHAMQQEIQALKSELEREKKAGHLVARAARIAETERTASFSQRIKDKDMLLEAQRKAQQDLVSKLQRCEAQIAGLQSSHRTADSPHRSDRNKKAVQKAEEAANTAHAKTKAMFEHYDSVQNKNTVLIGKMRMMAKAGGFDGPNTAFRKELDALKAPELTELDEYEENE